MGRLFTTRASLLALSCKGGCQPEACLCILPSRHVLHPHIFSQLPLWSTDMAVTWQ